MIKMKLRLLIAICVWLIPVSVLAVDSYLCVADIKTGFSFNKSSKKWKQSNFNVDNNKYIVSKSEDASFIWEVKKVGENAPFVECKNDFNKFGNLICNDNNIIQFEINNKTLRFMNSYLLGYVDYSDFEPFKFKSPPNAEKYNKEQLEKLKKTQKYFYDNYREGTNYPSIEIGKCSPL